LHEETIFLKFEQGVWRITNPDSQHAVKEKYVKYIYIEAEAGQDEVPCAIQDGLWNEAWSDGTDSKALSSIHVAISGKLVHCSCIYTYRLPHFIRIGFSRRGNPFAIWMFRSKRSNHKKKTLCKYDPTPRAICTDVCEAVRVKGSEIHGEAMGLYRLEQNDNVDDFKRLPLARPHYTFTNNNSVKFCLAYHDDRPWVLDGGSHRWAITRSSHSRNCTLPLVTLMGNAGDYKDILLFNKNQYSTPIQSRREDWTAFVFETFAVQVSVQ
jgi:hypothetical protein